MKLLIIAACAVPSLDGPQHLDSNTFAELQEDSARAVVAAGKGLHVDSKDDKTRGKTFTAPPERVSAVLSALKAAEKAEKAAAKSEATVAA